MIVKNNIMHVIAINIYDIYLTVKLFFSSFEAQSNNSLSFSFFLLSILASK